MAATVFLMSEMTGIPYVEICIAAILPAMFYFLALGLQIHFQAKKYKLVGMPPEEIPPARKVLREGWQFLVPFVVVIAFLFAGYSPLRAALWGLAAAVLAALVRKEHRKDLGKKIWASLEGGAKAAIMVVMCCAAAAMLVGVLYATGIGGKFSSAMLAVAGNSLFVALFMGMLGCLILGLPLPPPAAYLLTAIMIAPAAVSLGVPPMAAHLFAIYYSSLGQITPPAGAAMFVAGAIAGANPMTVGFVSMRLAIVGFVVPFMFCYNWGLVMIGTLVQILGQVIIAAIAFLALAAAFEGWAIDKIGWWQRVFLMGAGFLLIFPGLLVRSLAIFLFLVVLATEVKRHALGIRTAGTGSRPMDLKQ
jgi:TRAP transporter 4TM/12TM fusion protein